MNKLLIRSGTVITSQSMVQADIYVEDGKIRGIGQDLSIVEDARVVDAAGMYVMPGEWTFTFTWICPCLAQSPRMITIQA